MSDDDEFLIEYTIILYTSVKFKKSNKQFKQIHLKKKTEICLNYLYKGHCKYSENVLYTHISSVHLPMGMLSWRRE